MDMLELLEAGKVDEFNARREMGVRLDLFACDLSGKDLTGVNLAGANLQKADLSETNLTDAELSQTDLSGADLTGAVLKGISGMRSKWRDAYLGEADLSDADLAGADLTDADLSDVGAQRAMLTGARLKRAILAKVDLSAADMAEARLAEADLTGANLQGAQMREADLSRATLNGTKLGATDMTRVRLSKATLTEADLQGACLVAADLSGADLTGATVAQTDFTRADFTGAQVEGVDFSSATLVDAELSPSIKGANTEESVECASIFVEDPKIAANGTKIAVAWENPDRSGKPRIRIAHGNAGKPWNGKLGVVAAPADLAVSSSLVPHNDGFSAVTLLERPGGAIVHITPVGKGGKLGEARSMKLGYTPVVRPVVQVVDGNICLFGISRQGPAIRVDQVTEEGIEPVFGKVMPTARGFVNGPAPCVLSKGGVIMTVAPNRIGEPMRVPAGFPGRTCVAAPVEGGLAVAWIPTAGRGFRYSILRPGGNPEEITVLPKQAIGTLDAVGDGENAWVVFTREGAEPGDPAAAWCMQIPDGNPELVYEADEDADSIHFASASSGTAPTFGITTVEGALEVFTLSTRGPKHKWKIA